MLGEAVLDVALAPLRARLTALQSTPGPTPPSGTTAPRAMPATAAAPLQALRQVTILFLDIVGSTALGQRLDPEDIHALIDGTLARCTDIVHAHAGRVLQYAGDNLLAVFGAEITREDDAERGVRAGLALLDEGRRQGAVVKRLHGHEGFDVRVGLHTGSVLLGGGVDAEGSIRGSAVNFAARMEQTAPPGALRISQDTWRQVRGLFDMTPQPPLRVKGIDAPVATYLVQRASRRAFAATDPRAAPPDQALPDTSRVAGGEAPMVGREVELAQLLQVIDEAAAGRTLRRFSVVAEAGMGKSRLLLELERRLAALPGPVRVAHARARRHGADVPHGVVRDLLAWHCEIHDDDAPTAAHAKIADAFAPAFGTRAAEQSALVGQLIGLDLSADPHIAGIVRDGRQIRSRAFHALGDYMRHLCTRQAATSTPSGAVDSPGPALVVLLDDLHWSDDGSLDFVDHLAAACGDQPLVIGCFSRPALFERRPAWADTAGSGGSCHITLERLPAAASEALLDTLLAPLAVPAPRLRELLLRNGEGNPFHLIELLGMLLDDGVVRATSGGWTVDDDRLTHVRVPPTLVAVLQARLDALPPDERAALQQDSVIGAVFWDQALRDIAPEALIALKPLAGRDLIRRRGASSFAECDEYAFGHHLLHQVTYDTVLKAVRRPLHRRTADWLVAQSGGRVGEHLALIADHYERAGDAALAVRHLHRAAQAAHDAAAYGVALAHLARALALVPPNDLRTRFELTAQHIHVVNAVGDRAAQAADAVTLEQLAETLMDDACRGSAARQRALLALVTGDYVAAVAAADHAIALATLSGDATTALGALLEKGQALIYRGEQAAAQRCLEAALPLTRSTGRGDLGCIAWNRLNAIAQDRGEHSTARGHLQQALALAHETGNRRLEGALFGNMGRLQALLGRFDIAERLLRSGLVISREIGDRGSEPYTLQGLVGIALERGDPASALETATDALRLARGTGDRGCEAECMQWLGRCHQELAQAEQALTCFEAYDAWARRSSSGAASPPTAILAESLFACRRVAEALALVEENVRWLDGRPDGTHRDDLQRLWSCHRVLQSLADPRAGEFGHRAASLLHSLAGRLDEADRTSFLSNIRLHRDILASRNGLERASVLRPCGQAASGAG